MKPFVITKRPTIRNLANKNLRTLVNDSYQRVAERQRNTLAKIEQEKWWTSVPYNMSLYLQSSSVANDLFTLVTVTEATYLNSPSP